MTLLSFRTFKKSCTLTSSSARILDIQMTLVKKQFSSAQHAFKLGQFQVIFSRNRFVIKTNICSICSPKCDVVCVDLPEIVLSRGELRLKLHHLPGGGRGDSLLPRLRHLDLLPDDLSLDVAEDPLHLLATLDLADKLTLERRDIRIEVNKLNETFGGNFL